MNVLIRWEDPSATGGVRTKQFEQVKRPMVVAHGFYVIAEMGGREVMNIPLQRLVDVEYSDNTVSLLEKLG